ncbi:MAG: DUF86 domain-containing protein [Candidatus Magnetomorum sp.]|nr:DUF86 domain-containing protein [Candidatus Magnetomorum sp.]
MIDRLLIENKLRKIEMFIREIENEKAPKNFESFSKNIIFKRFVERNIELSIEQMINICKHFVSALDLQEPKSYANCFEIIADADIISKDTLQTFQLMARYRNLIIHGYDTVDDSITYGIFRKQLNDFRLFIYSVRNYLSRKIQVITNE